MIKYEVGQKVRIKEDIEVASRSSNNTFFASDMAKYRGQVVTISRIHNNDEKDYDIVEDGLHFTWAEEWFEPVNEVKTKADLKDGDIITLASGERLLFSNGDFTDLDEEHYNYITDLDDLKDDLTYINDRRKDDVVKVERPLTYYEVFNREETTKELTVEEISKLLGYEVKIVKRH